MLDEVRNSLGRSMGAMRAAECVVDVHVAQLGELLGEGRIVGLLFAVEAQVL